MGHAIGPALTAACEVSTGVQFTPAWPRDCEYGQGSTDAVLTLVRNWLRALDWIYRMPSLNHWCRRPAALA